MDDDRVRGDVVRVLRRAAELVEAGWTQHTYYRLVNEQHSFCALGAIREAGGVTEYTGRGPSVACKYQGGVMVGWAAEALSVTLGGSVFGWNDKQGRSSREVAFKLRETADRLAGKG